MLCRWKADAPVNVGRARSANILRNQPGPSKQTLRNCGGFPGDNFKLFITPDMTRLIATHTNEEGRQRVGNQWTGTNEEEIYTLLEILLQVRTTRVR